jgi:hypothetical protein
VRATCAASASRPPQRWPVRFGDIALDLQQRRVTRNGSLCT